MHDHRTRTGARAATRAATGFGARVRMRTTGRGTGLLCTAVAASLLVTGCSGGGDGDGRAGTAKGALATAPSVTSVTVEAPEGEGINRDDVDFRTEVAFIPLEDLAAVREAQEGDLRQQLLDAGVPEGLATRYVGAVESGDGATATELYAEIAQYGLGTLVDSLEDLSRVLGGKDVGQQDLRDLQEEPEPTPDNR